MCVCVRANCQLPHLSARLWQFLVICGSALLPVAVECSTLAKEGVQKSRVREEESSATGQGYTTQDAQTEGPQTEYMHTNVGLDTTDVTEQAKRKGRGHQFLLFGLAPGMYVILAPSVLPTMLGPIRGHSKTINTALDDQCWDVYRNGTGTRPQCTSNCAFFIHSGFLNTRPTKNPTANICLNINGAADNYD